MEGARVGLVQRKVVRGTTGMHFHGRRYAEVIFAHGITNRHGRVVLSFSADTATECIATAIHHDYLPARLVLPAGGAQVGVSVVVAGLVDTNAIDSLLTRDGIFGAGDSVWYDLRIASDDTTLGSCTVRFDTAGTGIEIEGSENWFAEGAAAYHYTDSGGFKLGAVPPGVNHLPVHFDCMVEGESEVYHTATLHLPVVGPHIVPLMTYLHDEDSGVVPEAGDDITMKLTLVNRYPVTASEVGARLMDWPAGLLSDVEDSTGAVYDIRFGDIAENGNITYTIAAGYSEETHGLLRARLRLSGSNMPPDTVEIDLNPLVGLDLAIDTAAVELDYEGGVRLGWNPQKYSDSVGRRSDFMGYVLMRRAVDESSGNWDLLTLKPVSSANFFHDTYWPDGDMGGKYAYRVTVVDSSYNFSAESFDTIVRAGTIKPGFPVSTASTGRKAPVVADRDKDGVSELYTVRQRHLSRPVGFRGDGHEAVVHRSNDGVLDPVDVDRLVWADLDADGFDEAILAGQDSLYVRNYCDTAASWTAHTGGAPHTSGVRHYYLKPVVADFDGDDSLEVLVMGMEMLLGSAQGRGTIDIYDSHGARRARRIVQDHNYAPTVAVGNFAGGPDTLEVIAAAGKVGGNEWHLFLLKPDWDEGGFQVADSVEIARVNTGVSVGELDGEVSTVELVFGVSADFPDPTADSLVLFSLDTASGNLGIALHKAPIRHGSASLSGCHPALGDIDGDGIDDIAFASEDSVYLLRVEADTLAPIVPPFAFGLVPDWRLGGYEHTPQPLLADIDNDDSLELVVNHQGDGNIRAFDIRAGDSSVVLVPGFPLKVAGKVGRSCSVTDMEADGILDLVALDERGWFYAWSLDSGSVYKQPWPSEYGNEWNTSCRTYRPLPPVGHVYETWDTVKTEPYGWLETGTNNSVTEVSDGAFVRDGLVLKTDSTGNRNYHLTGINLAGLNDYTIRGKIRFDSSDAEFGINFYSQWPDDDRKYSIVRKSDGLAYLYYLDGMTYTPIDTLAASPAGNDSLNDSGVWYGYQIRISPVGSSNLIEAWFWHDTSTQPDDPGITGFNNTLSEGGLVGVSTEVGSGTRYWSPITVTANDEAANANVAYEDFLGDTVVDVAPYIPANWYPVGRDYRYPVGKDTSGFVLDTAGGEHVMVFRHTPEIESSDYPKTILLTPTSNLPWRDYEFSGTLVKPDSSANDTAEVAVIVYYQDASTNYALKFKRDGIYLRGGRWTADTLLHSTVVQAGDSITYSFRGETNDVNDTILDAEVALTILLSRNGNQFYEERLDDESADRITSGVPGVSMDLSGIINLDSRQFIGLRTIIADVQKLK